MLIGLLIVAASIAAIIGGAVVVNRLTLKGGYDISSSGWRREVVVDSGGSFGCESGRGEKDREFHFENEFFDAMIGSPVLCPMYLDLQDD